MINQIQEPNPGLIEKNRIFGDQIKFFRSQVRGKIKDNWKFTRQLRVKLCQSKTSDQSQKGA